MVFLQYKKLRNLAATIIDIYYYSLYNLCINCLEGLKMYNENTFKNYIPLKSGAAYRRVSGKKLS